MTPQMIADAKRLVLCAGFEWQDGMVLCRADRTGLVAKLQHSLVDPKRGDYPDLTDAATGGVLFGWLCDLGAEVVLWFDEDGCGVSIDNKDYNAPTWIHAVCLALIEALGGGE